jgi:hypothetical protein
MSADFHSGHLFPFWTKEIWFMGGVFPFLEEISGGFDFIPTFPIARFIRKREFEKVS